mgnify:FL=1
MIALNGITKKIFECAMPRVKKTRVHPHQDEYILAHLLCWLSDLLLSHDTLLYYIFTIYIHNCIILFDRQSLYLLRLCWNALCVSIHFYLPSTFTHGLSIRALWPITFLYFCKSTYHLKWQCVIRTQFDNVIMWL